MKLRKHSGAKLAILGATAALFGGFFALVHSQPSTASQDVQSPAQPAAAPDYGKFFVPNATPGASAPSAVVVPAPAPHTRTRAS
jgi:hypothetical protein